MKFLLTLLLTLTLSQLHAEDPTGARRIKFLNYPDCIEFTNSIGTVAVLGHHVGGRVLKYSQDGKDALYLDPKEADWTPDSKKKPASAGRFDIGPEYLIPDRPLLWSGKWESEITGPRSARLTSQFEPATGVRLIRDFELDQNSSHLRCTQTIVNESKVTRRWCHWSRTFVVHGGIVIVPLTPDLDRFPNGYVMYRDGKEIIVKPEDPQIRRRGDILEILAPPAEPKLGMTTYAGWIGYQMPSDFAFVKRFATYPDRVYNEVAGLTVSIWYPKAEWVPACEIEPIGPMEIIEPGGEASFSEHWHLLPNKHPEPGAQLDLEALDRKVQTLGKVAP